MKAIILAAGAGTRMGQPKARLLIQGVPLALAHARRVREAGCARVVVVTRRADRAWLASEQLPWLETAISEAPDQGGSLRVGVSALEGAGAAEELVLVTPVDALPARLETLARLVAALDADAALVAASPTWRGTGGHPVAIRQRALVEAYGEGDGSAPPPPLRDVLRGLGPHRARIEVEDDAVVTNLDTPADVRALTGADPVFLRVSDL
jgi:CTP:molybdopterin cytidylyltransferase MocA